MQINANVAEADVGGIEEGQEVEFTVDAFPYRTFRGKVIQVRNSPLVVQNVVTYDSVIEVNNSDLKLKPGMTANVSIIVEERENVLTVPNGALRFRPPEDAILPVATNAVAEAGGQVRTNRMPGGGPGGPGGFGGGGGRRGGGGREGFGGRGGGEGLSGRRGGGSGMERRLVQTVYVVPGGAAQANTPRVKLKPVRVRLGISDGIVTEVLDGLNEGDVVVTGSNMPFSPQLSGQNPFGGGGGRGFRR
jgi:HlyD family secretion protein